jgi:hypothetical protein
MHAVRVKGFATTESIAYTIQDSVEAVEQVLADLRDDGWVNRRDGRVSGWRATPAGAAGHGRSLAADRARVDTDGLRDLHESFAVLNRAIKELCTAWQLRDGAPNDHGDRAYDDGVIEAVGVVHHQITDALRAAESFGRSSWYEPRLSAAYVRLGAGDVTALTQPLSDSYHDVWMELHQDLLLTLDLARTEADA